MARRRQTIENLETYAGSGPMVPGEYNCVARVSTDPHALLMAHAVPLTRGQARQLIERIVAAHPSLGECRVLFSSRSGRATRGPKTRLVPFLSYSGATLLSYTGRPRKRRERVRDAEGRVVMETRVSLPSKTRTAATANNTHSFAGLRVGVVLHEFAHALDSQTNGRMDPHGPRFTAILDKLVAWWAADGIFFPKALADNG